jgi:hypothetical protein
MKWGKDPRQSNLANLNNVRRENKKAYLTDEIEEFETMSKIKILGTL